MTLHMILARPVLSAALVLCLFAILASSYSSYNVLHKFNFGANSVVKGFPQNRIRNVRSCSTSLEALKDGAQEKIAALRVQYSELGTLMAQKINDSPSYLRTICSSSMPWRLCNAFVFSERNISITYSLLL